MKHLIIIGAGGFGREVLGWASDTLKGKSDWVIDGFLDANPKALNQFNYDYPILGDPTYYLPRQNEYFVCAIGDPKIKLELCRQLQKRNGQFFTLVHPTAIVGYTCKIGTGCIICPGSIITTNVTVGNFVTLNLYSTVGHDATIGDGCTLSDHTDVTGGTILGEGVFLGSHASILPQVTVGDYAKIGAGSVVVRKVKPHTTIFGVPAKQISLNVTDPSSSQL